MSPEFRGGAMDASMLADDALEGGEAKMRGRGLWQRGREMVRARPWPGVRAADLMVGATWRASKAAGR